MAEVRFNVVVDEKGALKKIEAIGGAFERSGEQSEKASKSTDKLGLSLGSLKGAAGAVAAAFGVLTTGAFAIFLKSSAEAASRAQETQNLFDVSFGSMASAAEQWALRTQAAVGVNDTTLKNFSGTLFNMVTSMGVARDEAFEMATSFTELALDASSFFNIPFDEAFNKIRAGLAGESEPLKQLGVLVTENTIKQTEFAQAILATGRQLTESEKVQARAIVIAQGLANAQGDLIRTQDSWANQTRLLGEAFVGLQETVGQFITNSQILGDLLSVITDRLNQLSTSIAENGGTWERAVTTGVLLFLRGVEQTINVAGFLVKALGFVVQALDLVGQGLTFGFSRFTDFSEGMRAAAEELKMFGSDIQGGADLVGSAIDDLVNASGRQRDAMEQVTTTTAVFEAQAGKLADTLKSALKQAIQEGGTIPTALYEEALASTSLTQDALNEVIGSYISQLTKQRDETKANTLATGDLNKAQKELASTMDKLSGADVLAQQEKMVDAIQRLGGASELSVTGIESLSGLIENLRKNSMSLSPELAAVALELDKIALRRDLAGVIDDLKAAELTTEDWKAALEGIPPELDNIDAGIAAAMGPDGQAIVGGIEKRTISWGDAMDGVNDFLSETRGLMTLMGVEADSTFGKIINGISKVFDAFNSLTGIIDKVLGAFGKEGGLGGLLGGLFGGGGGGGGGGLGSIFGGLGGLFGGGGVPGIGAQTAALGFPAAGEAAGGGFLSGFGASISKGFGALGKAAGALFTNPFGIAVVAGLGTFFALKGIFGRKGSAETTAEFLGIDFDRLTKDLKDRIQKMGEEVGDFATGIQLNLGELIQVGAVGDTNAIAEKIADTFSFLERGDISKDQAAGILGDTVPQLLAQFDQLGSDGTAQVERLLRAADSMGVEFAGQQDLVAALGQSLISSAQAGGDAWLSAVNAIGTTGRESLEFLINEFGSALPESARAAIEEILGLGAALGDDVAAGANSASADVTGLTGDVEVLGAEQPGTMVGNDIATGIGAGVAMALTDVETLQRALAELSATGINPPNMPNVPQGATVSAQGGFFSSGLPQDTTIRAHRGEMVAVGMPSQFRHGAAPAVRERGGDTIIHVSVRGGTIIGSSREFEKHVARGVAKGMRATANTSGMRTEIRQNVR